MRKIQLAALVLSMAAMLALVASSAFAQEGTAPDGRPPSVGGEIIERAPSQGDVPVGERGSVLSVTGAELASYVLLAVGTICAGASLLIGYRRGRPRRR